MSRKDTHVLIYPYPTPGHVIPILNFTNRLLERGVTITIAITPKNLALLDQTLSLHTSSSLVHTMVLSNPEPPPSSGANPFSNIGATVRTMHELHYPHLVKWFKSHTSPPDVIVSDFLLGWTNKLACQLGIPRVVFSPSGAFAFSVLSYTWRDLPMKGEGSSRENLDMNTIVSFPNIPNCPSYPWWQMPTPYRTFEKGDNDLEFYRYGILANLESWGFVFNSFSQLEQIYLNHLKKEIGHDRFWAIGPLLPNDDNEDTKNLVQGGVFNPMQVDRVMTWLDKCPNDTVVYVCFGTQVVLTNDLICHLAAGLEQSRVRFILCIREPKNGDTTSHKESIILNGFEDRVSDRGLVIRGWAPQVLILRHRAVGAFLTHCGWNSILEGLTAGLLMLVWPMEVDQYSNAKLLVEQVGVGIKVGEGTKHIPQPQELARVLADSMSTTPPERIRAKDVRKAALSAIDKGGNSDENLDEFIRRLKGLKKCYD